jgi:6-pyruvoyltetrahydropterin/6-carboxytetrahydropterin synthase
MIAVTRRYRFAASHRLHSGTLTARQNEELYGKCNHPFGHGHDYLLEVTVEGVPDPRTGILVPLSVLDGLVEEHVLRLFASKNINLEVPHFANLVPTTENIVRVIAEVLQSVWDKSIGPRAALRRVYVRETGRNSFEVLISRPADFKTQGVVVRTESVHAESKDI